MAAGLKGIAELVMSTHAGMGTDEFSLIVRKWLGTAKHPQSGRHYTQLVFQPMLELLGYLRDHGFATFIVSGGGVEFMRVFAEDTYGIRPHQVIGSTIETHFETREGRPILIRDPKLDFFDDKAGKPAAINKFIWYPPNCLFRQFRRRPRDVVVDDTGSNGQAPHLRAHRAPYRCRTRIRIRPSTRAERAS
jgi:hypothetical protein